MKNIRNDILADLAKAISNNLDQKKYCNYSLLGGDLGDIIFLYYYSRIDNRYEPVADSLLDKVFDSLNVFPVVGTYCNGFTGLGIALLALETDGFVSGASEALHELDQQIDITFIQYVETGKIDFLHGFTGYGFYFLKCYDKNPIYAKNHLMTIVSALEQLAISHGNGIKWKFSDDPMKRYNISLSHGMSSVVMLLCKIIWSVNLEPAEAKQVIRLIGGSVNYMLKQRIDPNKYGSWFVSTSTECEPHIRPSRLGWCYGDLGVAVALYHASDILQNSDLKQLAVEVLEYAAVKRRDPIKNTVYDTGLCHGAAGVAQIFKTMATCASSNVLEDASYYWDNMVMRNAIRTKNGYEYFSYNPQKRCYEQKSGLLDGGSGIGLYLLNAGNVLPQLLILS